MGECLHSGDFTVTATLLNAGWQVRVDGSCNSALVPLLLCDDDISRLRDILEVLKLHELRDEPFNYVARIIAGAAKVSMKPPF